MARIYPIPSPLALITLVSSPYSGVVFVLREGVGGCIICTVRAKSQMKLTNYQTINKQGSADVSFPCVHQHPYNLSFQLKTLNPPWVLFLFSLLFLRHIILWYYFFGNILYVSTSQQQYILGIDILFVYRYLLSHYSSRALGKLLLFPIH